MAYRAFRWNNDVITVKPVRKYLIRFDRKLS